jgi:hypothetical protein
LKNVKSKIYCWTSDNNNNIKKVKQFDESHNLSIDNQNLKFNNNTQTAIYLQKSDNIFLNTIKEDYKSIKSKFL